MAVTLVQGASRGLGLQFARVLASRPNVSKVIATSRTAEESEGLLQLRLNHPGKVECINLDVTNEDQIKLVSKNIGDITGGKLDLLVNCSAVLHPSGRGETSLKDVSFEGLKQTLAVNTFGPLLVAKHVAPMLLKGSGNIGYTSTQAKHCGVIVNITAKVSSITDNKLGGWYSYRLSKCALNMATRNLSIELGRGKSKVICVALHPGTVDTDLSRPYHKGVPADKLFSTEKSANYLMNIIDTLTVEDSGKFFAYDRTELPF